MSDPVSFFNFFREGRGAKAEGDNLKEAARPALSPVQDLISGP